MCNRCRFVRILKHKNRIVALCIGNQTIALWLHSIVWGNNLTFFQDIEEFRKLEDTHIFYRNTGYGCFYVLLNIETFRNVSFYMFFCGKICVCELKALPLHADKIWSFLCDKFGVENIEEI